MSTSGRQGPRRASGRWGSRFAIVAALSCGGALSGAPKAAKATRNRPVVKKAIDMDQPEPPPPVLGKPRGEMSTISGRFVEKADRLREDGPFRVMRIDGQALQEDIVIALRRPSTDLTVAPPIPGEHYTFRGVEAGHWIGTDGQPVVTPTKNSRFVPHFLSVRELPIPPVTYSPDQFVGRLAWLEGVASQVEGKAVIKTSGWNLALEGMSSWPADIEGKRVEAWGMVLPGESAQDFILQAPQWSLRRLDDQVGRPVELRGRPRHKNGWWWFEHRGLNLYIEKMEDLPGFRAETTGKDIIVSGKLERKAMPKIDRAIDGSVNDTALYYVVTGAKLRGLNDVESKIAVPYAGDVTLFYKDGHW